MILANPPFAGASIMKTTPQRLQRVVKTKKTEFRFLALFLKFLKPGGRAAVIVPDGVLFGSSTAHKMMRKMLVEQQKLDAIVKLPVGRVQAVCRVCRPPSCSLPAPIPAALTMSGSMTSKLTVSSLDDKRNPTAANDLPDALPSLVEPVETWRHD